MRLRSLIGLLPVLVVAACGDSPASDSAEPTFEAESPALEGAYRFATLNGQFPPVEFPAGSGAMLETGTLDLDPAGRFSMSFITGGPLGSEPSGRQGAYRVSADTLFLTPDGSAGAPEVFRFEVGARDLRLSDSQNNVWVYARRQGS